MKILAYDTFPQEGLSDFETVLTQSDVITLHVPLTPETKGLIGAAELKRMKKNAILINTARGGLVDEAALLEALKDGTIAGAGFDVVAQEPPKDGNISATRTCRTSSSRRTSPGRARRPCRSWPTNSSTTSRRSWRASRRTWSRADATRSIVRSQNLILRCRASGLEGGFQGSRRSWRPPRGPLRGHLRMRAPVGSPADQLTERSETR